MRRHRLGQVTIDGCAIDECVRKGGPIAVDGLDAGDVAQSIDVIVVNPWTPRPFGRPSRCGTREASSS